MNLKSNKIFLNFTLSLRVPSTSLVNCAPSLAITLLLPLYLTVELITHGSLTPIRLTDSSWVLPARKILGHVTR